MVADEVRKLSQSTTEATSGIQRLLATIETDSHEAVATMTQSMERSQTNLAQYSVQLAAVVDSGNDKKADTQTNVLPVHHDGGDVELF